MLWFLHPFKQYMESWSERRGWGSGTKASKHLAATRPQIDFRCRMAMTMPCRLYGQRRPPELGYVVAESCWQSWVGSLWSVWMCVTLRNTLIWTTAKLQAAKLTVHQTPDQPHLKTAHHLHVWDQVARASILCQQGFPTPKTFSTVGFWKVFHLPEPSTNGFQFACGKKFHLPSSGVGVVLLQDSMPQSITGDDRTTRQVGRQLAAMQVRHPRQTIKMGRLHAQDLPQRPQLSQWNEGHKTIYKDASPRLDPELLVVARLSFQIHSRRLKRITKMFFGFAVLSWARLVSSQMAILLWNGTAFLTWSEFLKEQV